MCRTTLCKTTRHVLLSLLLFFLFNKEVTSMPLPYIHTKEQNFYKPRLTFNTKNVVYFSSLSSPGRCMTSTPASRKKSSPEVSV